MPCACAHYLYRLYHRPRHLNHLGSIFPLRNLCPTNSLSDWSFHKWSVVRLEQSHLYSFSSHTWSTYSPTILRPVWQLRILEGCDMDFGRASRCLYFHRIANRAWICMNCERHRTQVGAGDTLAPAKLVISNFGSLAQQHRVGVGFEIAFPTEVRAFLSFSSLLLQGTTMHKP